MLLIIPNGSHLLDLTMGESPFSKKEKSLTPRSSIQSHKQKDHYLLTPICTRLIFKTLKKKTFSLDLNSFLNVRFQPVTHIDMVNTVTYWTHSIMYYFFCIALVYK